MKIQHVPGTVLHPTKPASTVGAVRDYDEYIAVLSERVQALARAGTGA